ncbi:unnamed protein product [Ambrosiozyma monospora]|uniref:Unnamed protein product n=1 Tax=Ambrosiozyma monospora TaxID=43982 RepID=A0ACB5UD02_AMBMO|nr:unnamed protein product [Ambrosiozyma monospora]
MSEHVPAWKRLGLKVKQTIDDEDNQILNITHLDSGKLTSKQAKKVKKRQLEQQDKEQSEIKKQKTDSDATKKPPKRKKLPKGERPPPPEKDQLAYLKQFQLDRPNWKFSKQKQNWILRNIKNISDDYEEYLLNYLNDLKGGSRDRLVSEMEQVINLWNER